MKILSDFDGVLTDQTEEGHRMRELFRKELIRVTGLSPAELDRQLERGEVAMTEKPAEHGWRMLGRITAFANEDLFVRGNGLAACFDGWVSRGDAALLAMKRKLEAAGFPDFNSLAQHAYQEMVKETGAGRLKPMDPGTPILINGLLKAGHEVVVVSNSGTDRILNLFQGAGLQAVRHESDPRAKLRIRGDARKFELGETSRGFQAGAYFVETSRPKYETILREERADAVIGDVFTLDLALPLHLSRAEPGTFGGVRLVLRERAYTPQWSRDLVHGGREETARFSVIKQLEEFSAILAK